jgi:hypothetical protein
MPTTEDGTKTGAAARAEQNDGSDTSFVSQDTFENPSLKLLANTATVTDGFGIERIVSVGDNDFTPAPTEATDEQKAAMEAFNSKLEEARTERTALLSRSAVSPEEGAQNAVEASDVGTADRAPNNPGDAGSQEGPSPAKDDNSTTTGGGQQPAKQGSQPADQKGK